MLSVRLISGNGFKGRTPLTRFSEKTIQNLKKEDEVATKQITIERFSVVSAKPFAEVVRAIDAQVGHPDINQLSPTSCIHELMLDTMLAIQSARNTA